MDGHVVAKAVDEQTLYQLSEGHRAKSFSVNNKSIYAS
jgi:hypothetical protein